MEILRQDTAKQYRRIRKILRSPTEDTTDEFKPTPYKLWYVIAIFGLLIVIVLLFQGCAQAYTLDQWADNIRITEGNNNYGILSIKTHNYRLACKQTVWNNWKRYKGNRSDLKGFVEFLGNRYCPYSVDPQGNINWKHNMLVLMERIK